MNLVVDASVACKWFVEELDSEHAGRILAEAEALIAPDLVVAETCNVAWKKWRAGEVTIEQATMLAAESHRFSTSSCLATAWRRARWRSRND